MIIINFIVMTVVSSAEAFINAAMIVSKLAFNYHGLQVATPPSSALPLSTTWIRMLQSALK